MRKRGLEVVIISLDFGKAFDRVEMVALKGTLQYNNFGENFIKWTMLLYKNFESCTTNFGYNSEWFHPTRGLHQGILIVEILGDQIRRDSRIKGIRFEEVEIKSTQFADDMKISFQFLR